MATSVEQPQTLIYVLGVTVIFLASALIGIMYLAQIDISQEYTLYNIQYSSTVSRMVNSPTCFALEESFELPEGYGTETQVQAGIIDWWKFNSGITKVCSDGRIIYAYLSSLDGTLQKQLLTGRDPLTALSDSDLESIDNWNTKQEKYYVLVYKDSQLIPAILEVRIKG